MSTTGVALHAGVGTVPAQVDAALSTDLARRLDLVLDRLPPLGGCRREQYVLSRLDSYTNATFRLTAGNEGFALRLAGLGTEEYVDRAAEHVNATLAAERGLAAPVVWFDESDGTMLTRWLPGTTTTAAALRDPDATCRAARALAEVHALGPGFRGRYDVFDAIGGYQAVLSGSGVRLPPAWRRLAPTVERIERSLAAAPVRLVPCHNDPYPGNLVDDGERVRLVDWEYAGLGDPAWDLADLSVEAGLGDAGDELLLATYFRGQVPAVAPSRLALLKVMSDAAWGVWSFVQVGHGNAAVDYEHYGLDRLERARQQADAAGFERHLQQVAACG